jgi:hypothetical protein
MSNQPAAEVATYNTQNHDRRTAMPSAEFEHAIAIIERPQTYALEPLATGIDQFYITGD